VPGAQDDVIIAEGAGATSVDSPVSVNSVLVRSPLSINAPLTLSSSSRFSSSVVLNADLSGNADVQFDSDLDWRNGTISGGGLGLFPGSATITIVGPGERRLSRVIEVFGLMHIRRQTLLLDRPEALIRVSESATLWLEEGATIQSDDSADPAFVVFGLLRSSGFAPCTISSSFFNFGTLRVENQLNLSTPPGNLDPATGTLQGGTWHMAGGTLEWPDDRPVRVIAPETSVRISGAGSGLVLHVALQRIEGSLESDAAVQTIAISNGVTPSAVTGTVRVTGGSRVAFNSGVVFADSAVLELEPSEEQPGISAISAVTTAADLGGVLRLLAPRQTPENCGAQFLVLSAFGTVDPVTGEFAQVTAPELSATQSYRYVVTPFVGNVIEGLIVENRSSADWNADTGIDGDDIIAFFSEWDMNEADINGDGGTDGDDIIVFFERWDRGC
jgi:hypothetical protein